MVLNAHYSALVDLQQMHTNELLSVDEVLVIRPSLGVVAAS